MIEVAVAATSAAPRRATHGRGREHNSIDLGPAAPRRLPGALDRGPGEQHRHLDADGWRAVGPAIAGVLIARTGVWVVFALNTAGFLVFILALAAWHPNRGAPSAHPEQFISALQTGGRYVRFAPVVRRILIRVALFLLPA